MARRSGGSHKGVEEKRRSLPIYQHYTLSPGKTKSHHPEAKCNHCLKEFVCGSKQRLIRHLRKCNSISNPDDIIAETLNTLARNSATGTLNHSILEASNLLPSQIPHHHRHNHNHHQNQQQAQLQQQQLHHQPTGAASASNNCNITNNNHNHNTSGSSNDTGLIASSSNGSQQQQQQPQILASAIPPVKRSQRRGRKPANHSLASASIHVTTGLDGKTHFTPASQLPQANLTISGAANASVAPGSSGSGAPTILAHNGRQLASYTYHHPVANSGLPTASPTPLAGPCGGGATNTNHHHHHQTATQAYKLNPDPVDKAYLKLVLTRNLPLSLCDTREFQLWVKTFANDYKPPSSINLIAQNLKNESHTAKQRISNILVKAPKKTINLELHSWPEELRRHLWYAVIANIDHKRFLISIRDIYMQQQQQASNNNDTTSLSSSAHQSNSITPDKVLAEFIDDCIKRIGSDRINSLLFSASLTGDSLTLRARQALYTTHPSIVTYHCWWHFTNLLCADIVENNSTFQHVLRNSNRLINFVNKRPNIGLSLEKFSPFAGVTSSIYQKKNDRRWYSHLVCYLLEYIKNNNEAIIRALEATAIQSQLASDNNNNSSSGTGNNNTQVGIEQQTTTLSTQQHQQSVLYQEDAQLIEVKAIVMSTEYWNSLNVALVYLKPIHDLVALTSTVSSQPANNNNNNNLSIPNESNVQQATPVFSPNIANGISLSDYMYWFLKYGKTLFDSYRQTPDDDKFQLIGRYLTRFNSSISGFKLLFAAYLLNPKHRFAFMTQKAKNTAIEEILNIASEFMPEESDGHTIFDQWKLYLVREEPYDMVFEENRSTPLEWWMSLPCAESIRRVALRILRLKAFTSPKPETLFSQLYFYEDETKSSLNDTTFEDTAVLRYFYDYEDKIVQTISQQPLHNNSSSTSSALNSSFSNGFHDRTQVGQMHNEHLSQSNYSSGGLDVSIESNGQQLDESMTITNNESSRQDGYSESFTDAVDPYLGNHHHSHLTTLQPRSNLGHSSSLAIEDLPGYDLFIQYIDYNETGVQIVEEPIEKKKRKWTAQEILSKCQSNHINNNNDLNHNK